MRADELKAARYLGINGIQGSITDKDARDGFRFGIASARVMFFGPSRFNDPIVGTISQYAKQFGDEASASPHRDTMVATLESDEACAKDLKAMAGDPVDQLCFVEWLRAEGHTPRVPASPRGTRRS